MTKLTADTPEYAEVVINSVTLSVMITATVGIVIKMRTIDERILNCKKCQEGDEGTFVYFCDKHFSELLKQ
ncbi:hypothetical protein LCGC14_1606320 [marine sediment metagenome]|uniref:Uncharacterized protein n=1 Tax=marine sediment metagenome TaxID=412755 RepID=A0A0F9IA04_9ZZZZ